MSRVLNVFIDEAPVGVLEENQGVWSFQYLADWVATGYELAPGLTLTGKRIEDTGTDRPVQWFFDNLLPEDTARAELYASLPGKGGDAWDLLAQYGAESAGALTLLPPGAAQAPSDLQVLSDAELERRIQAMPRQPLATGAPKKMSLAGAQQKLPVVVDAAGALFDPVGARASSHILKPDVLSPHYPFSAVNEWFCARLAKAVKLPVPAVALLHVPSSVYRIERFDRSVHNGRLERRHTLDALQLLSLAAGAKYSRSGTAALLDIVAKCRVKATTRLALFRWTLFNALVGNSDAHLKNLSLFASRQGYALAPHYDLVSTAAWARPDLVGSGERMWPDMELSFPIGQARTFAELTVQDFVVFGKELGIEKLVNGELSAMTGAILPAARQIIEEYAQRTDVPEGRRAGELHMLRCILNLPLAEMQRRLAAPL